MSTVNRKYRNLMDRVTLSFVSHFLDQFQFVNIHRIIERSSTSILAFKKLFQFNVQCLILYILKHNLVLKMKSVQKSVYGGTKSPVYVSDKKSSSQFSICIYFLSQQMVYFRYTLSLKWYRFWKCNFVKVYTFLQEIRCIKNQKVGFSRNESDLIKGKILGMGRIVCFFIVVVFCCNCLFRVSFVNRYSQTFFTYVTIKDEELMIF